ncbi:hypothetical protein, partial [Streptomyces anulatus]|uniref:hypothetical protein n=1 Tax=Streptomyces anulatus TaxID=1892 RepID=UPI00343773A5
MLATGVRHASRYEIGPLIQGRIFGTTDASTLLNGPAFRSLEGLLDHLLAARQPPQQRPLDHVIGAVHTARHAVSSTRPV